MSSRRVDDLAKTSSSYLDHTVSYICGNGVRKSNLTAHCSYPMRYNNDSVAEIKSCVFIHTFIIHMAEM